MLDTEYIYAVYTEKSFSKAAKKLFLSQPALSAAVKKTEENLGITIFDRSTSPISLTDEGRVYIETIEKIHILEEDMKTILADMTELKHGHITVSGENFVSSFIMPKIFLEFSEKYPGIDIEITESNSPDLFKSVLNGTSDLLIAHDFNDEYFDSEPLFNETLLLAVPTSFEINKRLKEFSLTKQDIDNDKYMNETCPSVSLKEFENEDFILLKKGNDARNRADSLFLEAGITPRTKLYLDQLITSYNMVCSGVGIAFVTDMVVKNAREQDCLFYKIKGTKTHRTMYVGYKKGRYLSKAIKAFIETAKDVYS